MVEIFVNTDFSHFSTRLLLITYPTKIMYDLLYQKKKDRRRPAPLFTLRSY